LAGALPQTPLGELTALPRLPSWIEEVLLLRKGREGREQEGWGGEEQGGEGRGEVRVWKFSKILAPGPASFRDCHLCISNLTVGCHVCLLISFFLSVVTCLARNVRRGHTSLTQYLS